MNKYYFVGIPKVRKHGFRDIKNCASALGGALHPDYEFAWSIESKDSFGMLAGKVKSRLYPKHHFALIENKEESPRFVTSYSHADSRAREELQVKGGNPSGRILSLFVSILGERLRTRDHSDSTTDQ